MLAKISTFGTVPLNLFVSEALQYNIKVDSSLDDDIFLASTLAKKVAALNELLTLVQSNKSAIRRIFCLS